MKHGTTRVITQNNYHKHVAFFFLDTMNQPCNGDLHFLAYMHDMHDTQGRLKA